MAFGPGVDGTSGSGFRQGSLQRTAVSRRWFFGDLPGGGWSVRNDVAEIEQNSVRIVGGMAGRLESIWIHLTRR